MQVVMQSVCCTGAREGRDLPCLPASEGRLFLQAASGLAADCCRTVTVHQPHTGYRVQGQLCSQSSGLPGNHCPGSHEGLPLAWSMYSMLVALPTRCPCLCLRGWVEIRSPGKG